jgi:two-component system alkaline phosphatase synthesis response regulator PhoP
MAKKILLVDDSITTRMTNRTIISRRTGHDVVCAANGPEALKLVGSERPDLVLMDVMMPGMDGLEVCRRLRKEQATASLPIVLLTFRVDDGSVEAGFDSGCTAYLKKPLVETELLQALKQYLGD